MISPTRIQVIPTPKYILGFALLLLAVFLLHGCATLNESDCRKGNWSGIGYNDAVAGLRSNVQLNSHIKACSRYQIGSDQTAYHSGYARGLQQFCTQSSGMRFASENSEYFDTCPTPLKRNFLIGYVSGLALSMDNLRDDIEDLRHERRQKDRQLSSLQKGGHKDKKHSKSVKKLKDKIENIEDSISNKRSKYNELRAWHSAWSHQI